MSDAEQTKIYNQAIQDASKLLYNIANKLYEEGFEDSACIYTNAGETVEELYKVPNWFYETADVVVHRNKDGVAIFPKEWDDEDE